MPRRLIPKLSDCALLTMVVIVWLARSAAAQCTSNSSSCVICHEIQGAHAVLGAPAAPWHADHGFGDLCSACHGGDPASTTELPAHAGMREPLADGGTTCASCHPRDASSRVQRYIAATLAVPAKNPLRPTAADAAAKTNQRTNAADRALAVVAIALGGALYFATRSGSAHNRRFPSLKDAAWNPYIAGALLGVAVAVSNVWFGRPLAVSGAFDKLAAYVGRALFPSSQYYVHLMTRGITWQVWLVLGLLLGSFAASKSSLQTGLRWLPDSQWEPRFGSRRSTRLAIAFVGASLVQFGAGIAGGCTSGLAISGGAVLAPAAFLFMAGMFAAGIPTAWLWYRGRD